MFIGDAGGLELCLRLFGSALSSSHSLCWHYFKRSSPDMRGVLGYSALREARWLLVEINSRNYWLDMKILRIYALFIFPYMLDELAQSRHFPRLMRFG